MGRTGALWARASIIKMLYRRGSQEFRLADDPDAVVGRLRGRREPNCRWGFRATFQREVRLHSGGCTSKSRGSSSGGDGSSASRMRSGVS